MIWDADLDEGDRDRDRDGALDDMWESIERSGSNIFSMKIKRWELTMTTPDKVKKKLLYIYIHLD